MFKWLLHLQVLDTTQPSFLILFQRLVKCCAKPKWRKWRSEEEEEEEVKKKKMRVDRAERVKEGDGEQGMSLDLRQCEAAAAAVWYEVMISAIHPRYVRYICGRAVWP